jgi:hypothetical protein
MAQRREVAVAHVARQRKVLLERLAVLVFASPRLNCIELGRLTVEDVRVDDGDEGEQSGWGCGSNGYECAQGGSVGEVDLLILLGAGIVNVLAMDLPWE